MLRCCYRPPSLPRLSSRLPALGPGASFKLAQLGETQVCTISSCCTSGMAANDAAAAQPQQQDLVTQLRERLGGNDGPTARLLRKGGEAFDDGTLQRWLTSRKNNVQEAAQRLQEHAKWRSTYVPNGRIDKREVKERLDEKMVYLQGFDLEGRPVVYIIGKNIVWRFFSDNDLVKRFLCFVLDTAIQCMSPEQQSTGKITVIFDLSDFGMRNADPHILPTMFDLLGKQYPERLATAVIYNAPTIFWAIWQGAQQFMDPVVQQKIVFVEGEEGKQEIHARVSTDVLPRSVGGSGALIPVEQALANLAAD